MRNNKKNGKTQAPKRSYKTIFVAALGCTAIALIAAWFLYARTERSTAPQAKPTYVGEETCAHCHAEEAQAWRVSHHAVAMQPANKNAVLGNFHTRFVGNDIQAEFSTQNERFRVETPLSRGSSFDVPYTFGVYPLQQYLIPVSGGRLQSFVLAWDSRDQKAGGQRWFNLYPGQKIPPGDPLHWTGRNQTWNFMCADCHSTNLRKNYDLTTDTYKTTWSEISVSCETCHGPGSSHIAWAKNRRGSGYGEGGISKGLVVSLKQANGRWAATAPNAATMHWTGEPRSHTEVETCAPCHSRRHPITADPQPGTPLLDSYMPSLLEEGVYYADGQIQEEDYEWGSFIQSKMYHQGVNCSDCHNPHSGKLASADLNAVCGKCHSLAKFGTEQHHHHTPATAGALCVNCHMPSRTYMVVDARRDHSFRVPRPDFSVAYGTPNACNQCHQDRSKQWAANAIAGWYGPNRRQETHFITALDAGRRGLVNAEAALAGLVSDNSKPAIARATALTLLPDYFTPASLPALQTALADTDPLVRTEAVRALEPLDTQDRIRFAAPLLRDPVRSVRIESARLLAGAQAQLSNETQKRALDQAIQELIASEMVSAERPENHVNLSLIYLQMGRTADAEAELQTALRIDPKFVPAMVNLADFYRLRQRDDEAQRWLEKAMAVAPDAAEPVYALGLLKVRQKQYAEALTLLGRAAAMQPADPRYSYVYAVALNSTGQADRAIAILQDAHQKRPAERQILIALITFERDHGNSASATRYAEELVRLTPDDPNARALLAQLQRP